MVGKNVRLVSSLRLRKCSGNNNKAAPERRAAAERDLLPEPAPPEKKDPDRQECDDRNQRKTRLGGASRTDVNAVPIP